MIVNPRYPAHKTGALNRSGGSCKHYATPAKIRHTWRMCLAIKLSYIYAVSARQNPSINFTRRYIWPLFFSNTTQHMASIFKMTMGFFCERLRLCFSTQYRIHNPGCRRLLFPKFPALQWKRDETKWSWWYVIFKCKQRFCNEHRARIMFV